MDRDNIPELSTIWDEARQYINSGTHDKAIEIYKYILVRYGDNAVAAEHANAYLGDLFLTLQKIELAENHTKKAIDLKPENPGYRYILGFVYSYKRQWDKAIPEFEIAVAREPDNGEYLRGLGWALHESGDAARGLVSLEKASRLAPDNANILTDMAVAYLSSVNIDKAREYAERAVRMDPTNPVAQDVLKKFMGFSKGFSQPDKIVAKTRTKPSNYADTHFIHRFKVSLRDKPDVWRIIEIKHNQMLSSLHKAIFNAFDRYDEHFYSFFMNNEPWDDESEYNLPDPDEPGLGKPAQRARIDSLYLKPGQKFLYVFDYGDEWWHEVEFIGTTDENPLVKYPRVTKKLGKSPPQYSDDAER